MSSSSHVWRQMFTVTPGHKVERDIDALRKALTGLYRDPAARTSPTFRLDHQILFATRRTPADPSTPAGGSTMGNVVAVITQALTQPRTTPTPGLTPVGAPYRVNVLHEPGSVLDFQLSAHPTRAIKVPERDRSKRVTIHGEVGIEEWLHRKLDGAATLHPMSRIGPYEQTRGLKHPINVCLIEGRLSVVDTQKFADLLVRGVGRDRAYGAGLLITGPATQ